MRRVVLLDEFTVPDFHLPFRSHKHARAQQANDDAVAWSLHHGLIRRRGADAFAGIGFGHLAARVEHRAPYEHVVVLARWMAWSFVLDDQHDHLIRTGQLDAWRPVTDAIRGQLAGENRRQPPRDPLTRTFIELCDLILPGMRPETARRFTAHILDMLNSMDQEATNRLVARPPEIDDYVLMRRHSSQLPAMMDMSEASLDIEISPKIYSSPTFQELLWSATDVISWGNDLFSLRKEAACGDNNNIAVVLADRQGLTQPQVIRAVQERIAARVEDFLAAERELPHTLDTLGATTAARAAALTCCANFRDWMIGGDLWQRHDCTRYQDERWVNGLEGAYTHPDLLTQPASTETPR
jgi:hypothetical protein